MIADKKLLRIYRTINTISKTIHSHSALYYNLSFKM